MKAKFKRKKYAYLGYALIALFVMFYASPHAAALTEDIITSSTGPTPTVPLNFVTGRGSRIDCNLLPAGQPADGRCGLASGRGLTYFDNGFRDMNNGRTTNVPIYISASTVVAGRANFAVNLVNPGVCVTDNGLMANLSQLPNQSPTSAGISSNYDRYNFDNDPAFSAINPATGSVSLTYSKRYAAAQKQVSGAPASDQTQAQNRLINTYNNNLIVNYDFRINTTTGSRSLVMSTGELQLIDTGFPNYETNPSANVTDLYTQSPSTFYKQFCGILQYKVSASLVGAIPAFKFKGVDYYRFFITATTSLPYRSASSSNVNRPEPTTANNNNTYSTNDIEVYNNFRLEVKGGVGNGFIGLNNDNNSMPTITNQRTNNTSPDNRNNSCPTPINRSDYDCYLAEQAIQVNHYTRSNSGEWTATLAFALPTAQPASIGFLDFDGGNWDPTTNSFVSAKGSDGKNKVAARVYSVNPCTLQKTKIQPPFSSQAGGDYPDAWDGINELGSDNRRIRNYVENLGAGLYYLELTVDNPNNNIGVKLPNNVNLYTLGRNCGSPTATITASCSATGNISFQGRVTDSDWAGSLDYFVTINRTSAPAGSFERVPSISSVPNVLSTAADGSFNGTASNSTGGTGTYLVRVDSYGKDATGARAGSTSNSFTVTCGTLTLSCNDISDIGNYEPGQAVSSRDVSVTVVNGTAVNVSNASLRYTFPSGLASNAKTSPVTGVNVAARTSGVFMLTNSPNSITAPSALATIPISLLDSIGNTLATATCDIIAKTRPYFRVVGGDITTGDSIYTFGTTDKVPGAYYGAGADYAVFANGLVDATSITTSRNAFFSRMNATRLTSQVSSLIFANSAIPINSYGGEFSITDPTLSIFSGGTCIADGSGNILGRTIGSNTISDCGESDVVIRGNIMPGYNPTDGRPYAFKLLARNIYVDSSVTQLNGLYIAGTKFSTCGNPSDGLSALQQGGACYTNSLTIYGAVMANKIEFRRTAGTLQMISDATTEKSNASESFIYSPEMFLWDPTGGGGPTDDYGTPQYQSLTNLPPIF